MPAMISSSQNSYGREHSRIQTSACTKSSVSVLNFSVQKEKRGQLSWRSKALYQRCGFYPLYCVGLWWRNPWFLTVGHSDFWVSTIVVSILSARISRAIFLRICRPGRNLACIVFVPLFWVSWWCISVLVMHFPGTQGRAAFIWVYPESISISLPLVEPSKRRWECRFGGGSKVGHLETQSEFPCAATWL